MLIHRFEAMSSDMSSASSPLRPFKQQSRPPSGEVNSVTLAASAPVPASDVGTEKDKSPIRQSIRNLLSVFRRSVSGGKKGADAPDDSVETDNSEKELPLVPDGRYLQVTAANGSQEGARLHGVQLFDSPVPPLSLDETAEKPRKSPRNKPVCGILLYLSQVPNQLGSFPDAVWLPCRAVLEYNSITISWAKDTTKQIHSPVHTISLVRCTDIRSLTSSQVEEQDTKAPLVGCADDLHIEECKLFEIMFEGREREKFAARTVRERARWVSAIWDVVLPPQEPRSSSAEIWAESPNSKPNQYPEQVADMAISTVTSPSQMDDQQQLCSMTPRSLTRMDKGSSIHQVGIAQTLAADASSHSPLVSSIYSPTRPSSRNSRPDSIERCCSPSLMNLNHMSVVKQRLAQIKRVDSLESSLAESSSDLGQSSRYRPNVDPSSRPTQNTGEVRDSDLGRDRFTRFVVRPGEMAERVRINSTRGFENGDSIVTHDSGITRSNQVGDKGTLGVLPLLDLLRNHISEQQEHVTRLGDQIACLQDGVQQLPQEITCILGSSREGDGPQVQQMVTRVDRKVEASVDILEGIEEKLTTLGSSWQSHADAKAKHDRHAAEARRSLDDIQGLLKSSFPAVFARLAQIQEAQESGGQAKNERPPLADRNKELPPVIDLSVVLSKLDALLSMQRKVSMPIAGKANSSKLVDSGGKEIKNELAKISSLLVQNNHQRVLHSQQQADSVRYLTELNAWLEAFVNNGTSEIQTVAANVEHLCRALGCSGQANVGGSSTDLVGPSNLIQDLRELVASDQAREKNYAELQKSIDILLEATKNSNLTDLGSVVDVIEQHRQDQANLFKAMTNGTQGTSLFSLDSGVPAELSTEIRGERLRFVEAMKEATSINIQAQLEQFKQSLATEVVNISNEIGRLHQEKRAIESQVQELAAFHEKQRHLSGMRANPSYYQHQFEEFPTLTSHGHMSFPGS
ncbi:hypothetical protein AX17_001454 [Amanita inopinata Kibby_2008]|nr:hypothetical protein AX17_001454 [Amanita inopinata Kibby_2008]